MDIVYRLYLLQILLLLASVMYHGLAQTIAITVLILTMAFLWYVLWGASHLARKQAEMEEIEKMLKEIQHKR